MVVVAGGAGGAGDVVVGGVVVGGVGVVDAIVMYCYADVGGCVGAVMC